VLLGQFSLELLKSQTKSDSKKEGEIEGLKEYVREVMLLLFPKALEGHDLTRTLTTQTLTRA
jgi:aspartate/tyrosine/aromatic aminotransferase